MCRRVIFALLLLAGTALALNSKEEGTEELRHRAEAAPVSAQPALYTRLAERQLRTADQLYNDGKAEAGLSALSEMETYAEKAADAAQRSGNRLKDTEISIRKMAEKLRNMQRTLAFEDRQPVQHVVDQLEALRTGLLSRMFGKAGKK
jgi:hypothetical protein